MHTWAYFEEHFPMVIHALKRAAEAGTLAHAYLIVSTNSDYRTQFPLLLSCLAACGNRNADGSPCCKCENCTKILNGLYPDFHTLAPTSKAREIVIGKDTDDIDTLRWFEAQFHLSASTSGGWKIGVIQEADTMNESAQNAFLKTLEEPPGKCFFLLTTARASRLLPTIRSRCQILYLTDNCCEYDFPRCGDVPGLLAKLVEPMEKEKSLMAASDAANALIAIASALYKAAEKEAEEEWNPRLEQAKELESAGLKLLEKRLEGATGSKYRKNREQFMSLIHSWCAVLALKATGIPPEILPDKTLAESMGDLPERIGEKRSFKILDHAGELLAGLRTNVNDELALRVFCLNAAVKTRNL
ncbi:MAG: DNA polymerase III subunit [Lentisphaeria bacterium]|nr:DNA polymerase III subunit [Lentisphaeria bacterium]